MPTHNTHNGGGCWIAYNKYTPWATAVRNLTFSGTCPKVNTCAIELTLHYEAKSTIIACCLTQSLEDHSHACKTLSRLTNTLTHHTNILGGDFQGNWTSPNVKDDNIRKLLYRRWTRLTTPTFLPHQSRTRPHALTISPYGTHKTSHPNSNPPTRSLRRSSTTAGS